MWDHPIRILGLLRKASHRQAHEPGGTRPRTRSRFTEQACSPPAPTIRSASWTLLGPCSSLRPNVCPPPGAIWHGLRLVGWCRSIQRCYWTPCRANPRSPNGLRVRVLRFDKRVDKAGLFHSHPQAVMPLSATWAAGFPPGHTTPDHPLPGRGDQQHPLLTAYPCRPMASTRVVMANDECPRRWRVCQGPGRRTR
jgi:hypothetical protein